MMLEIDNIAKSYNKQNVLKIKSILVKKGECVALLGNNGSGKTTLLKSVVDLVKIDEGEIKINFNNVSNTEDWKNNTSIYLTKNMLIPFLKPKEYLEFIGDMRNISKREVNKYIHSNKAFDNDSFFESNKVIRELSLGNQHKIGLLGALLGSNSLILLDEPYANLDYFSKSYLSKKIREVNEEKNCSFIIASHNLEDVFAVASRIILLDKGKIVLDTSSDKIHKDKIIDILNHNKNHVS